jgi:hypothetical protein
MISTRGEKTMAAKKAHKHRKTKLTIKGKGECGSKVHCDISFDSSGNLIIKDKSGKDIAPLSGNPNCTMDDNIIEGLASKNPTWVKIGGRWYKIG